MENWLVGGAEQALKKLCVRALLDSDADCLMTVASYGPSLTEMQLLKQTNWEDPTGHGLVLIRQIRTALAVLNLLLNPAEPDGLLNFFSFYIWTNFKLFFLVPISPL